MTNKRAIRGVRDSVPGGTVLGRDESGHGPVKPLSMQQLAIAIAKIFTGKAPKNSTGALTPGATSIFASFTGGGGTPQVGFFADRPLADNVYIGKATFTKAVTFPSGWGGVGSIGSPATSDASFDIRKNGVSVGSVLCAAGATTPTFSGSASFAASDSIQIYGPSPADATLGDVSATLTGTAA